MSVVVLDIEEEKMYSDTAVSFGSVDCARYKKVQHYTYAGYEVLVGGVGIPEAIDILQGALLSSLDKLKQLDLEPGTYPSIMLFDKPDLYTAVRDMLNTISERTSQNSDLLIYAKHIKSGKTYVGTMNNSALVQWDVKPVLGDHSLVIGSVECVTAWNATDRSSGIYSRLSTLQRVVQYLKTPNEFLVTTIDGKEDVYIPD